MINRIVLKNLFKEFSYDIRLNEQRVNIITGPNGFGKTTILKIIESIAEKGLLDVFQFSFSSIEISTDFSTLVIEKNEDSRELVVNNVALHFYRESIAERIRGGRSFLNMEAYYNSFKMNGLIPPSIDTDSLYPLVWANPEVDDLSDKLIQTNYLRSSSKREKKKMKELDAYLVDFKKSIGNVKLLREQRLLRQESLGKSDDKETDYIKAVEVIKEMPLKMKDEIKKALLAYSQKSSELDSSFPERLLSQKEDDKRSSKDADQIIHSISQYQTKIADYNLMKNIKRIKKNQIKDERFKTIFITYLSDTLEKYSSFDELIKKIELFTSIVNSKLTFKRIHISNEYGFRILKEDGEELQLEKLSSGEQQIIVLYYSLIFETQNNTLLLIDEPEISLHVAWQREIVNDLNRIIQLKEKSLSVIVATHSPQIVGNSWDSAIELGEIRDAKQ